MAGESGRNRGAPPRQGERGESPFPRERFPGTDEICCFQSLDLHNGDTIGRENLLFGGIRMLDYKEIIKHYGGGMSGRALVEQGGVEASP